MLKLDVLAAELNLWANETEQIYRATKEVKYRGDAKHLRYLAATLNQSSLPATGVTQIVAGTNVTINPTGGTGIVTINSSGTIAAQFVIDYTYNITGAKDNVNTNYNTSQPFLANTTRVYLNGLRLTRGIGYDYVEAGLIQITMALPLAPTDQLIIEYQIS